MKGVGDDDDDEAEWFDVLYVEYVGNWRWRSLFLASTGAMTAPYVP